MFFIETLADLEMNVRAGRTPERTVGSLAHRTPGLHARPNVHHRTLMAGELSGAGAITMDARIIVPGGRPVELEGQEGVVSWQFPEEEALARWQHRDFLALERFRAEARRVGPSLLHPQHQRSLFKPWVSGSQRPRSPFDAKWLADGFIDGSDRHGALQFGLSLLGVSEEVQGG